MFFITCECGHTKHIETRIGACPICGSTMVDVSPACQKCDPISVDTKRASVLSLCSIFDIPAEDVRAMNPAQVSSTYRQCVHLTT